MHHSLRVITLVLLVDSFVFADPPQLSSAKLVGSRMIETLKRLGPKPGDLAPDFELELARGGTLRASELWSKRPVVITTGSHSCPLFRESAPGRKELFKEFSDRVDFVMIYILEAHPAGGQSPYSVPSERKENKEARLSIGQPKTYADRLKLAQQCSRDMQLDGSVAVDTIDNATWEKYGNSPNCGYLIAPGGKVVLKQGLFDAAEMRTALLKLLGEAD